MNTKTKLYLDRQNIRRLNMTPVGEMSYITVLLDNGMLKTYDTLVTENERSIKMSELKEKRKAIRFKEDELIDLCNDNDDGFVSD